MGRVQRAWEWSCAGSGCGYFIDIYGNVMVEPTHCIYINLVKRNV